MNPAPPCIPNIGPRGKRRRRMIAAGSFAVAAFVAGALIAIDAPRTWRLVLFAPLWFGALCLFQARSDTCVYLADKGVRNMDGGDVRITDAVELQAISRQATRIRTQTVLTAIVLTALFLMIPM